MVNYYERSPVKFMEKTEKHRRARGCNMVGKESGAEQRIKTKV